MPTPILSEPGPIRFDGQVAIVTGAGSGLGLGYAKALAARGAAVVVNDLGTDPLGNSLSNDGESPAERVTREIREAGGTALACHESCATREGGDAIAQAALDAFGRVDILIHSAGFLRNAPFEEMTDAQIRSVMDVHLMAGFYVGQPVYRAMKSQGYGRIILTSSASALFGSEWQANYGAAKAGLAGLVNVLALEGAKHGIQVNGLLPCGPSRMGRRKEDWPDDFRSHMPDGRELIEQAIHADFIVPMVVWLASARCGTSHALYSATGGRFARVFVGEGNGWLSDYDHPPTPEDIERHLGEIDDTASFDIPTSMWDEFRPIIAARREVLAHKAAASASGPSTKEYTQ